MSAVTPLAATFMPGLCRAQTECVIEHALAREGVVLIYISNLIQAPVGEASGSSRGGTRLGLGVGRRGVAVTPGDADWLRTYDTVVVLVLGYSDSPASDDTRTPREASRPQKYARC